MARAENFSNSSHRATSLLAELVEGLMTPFFVCISRKESCNKFSKSREEGGGGSAPLDVHTASPIFSLLSGEGRKKSKVGRT
jgi:hypothetical protein